MASSAVVEQSVQDETVSEAIVIAVADFTGSEFDSLEPLNNVVDPDALNTLFEADRFDLDQTPNRIAFTYCGCDVVISSDGSIQVTDSGQEIPE